MTWSEPSPEEIATQANLTYITDKDLTLRRQRWGRGFTWRNENGEVIQDKTVRQQLIDLAIPPAWQDVKICPHSNGHILAVGRDGAGRKQYIYHPKWKDASTIVKFERLRHFAHALPNLRQKVEKDIGQRKLQKSKVTAVVVLLLDETGMRIGHEQYTKQNDSYGLTTLTKEHLTTKNNKAILHYKGKAHIEREVVVTTGRIVSFLEKSADLAGQRLFQYKDDDDELQTLTSDDVNNYLRDCTNLPVSAKDFRTWRGTVSAVEALHNYCHQQETAEPDPNLSNYVIDEVCRILGNTPAVCRDHYIHPAILKLCDEIPNKKILTCTSEQKKDGYSPFERLTINLLESQPT